MARRTPTQEPETEERETETPPSSPAPSRPALPSATPNEGLRSQLAEIPRLIQTNMALLEQKYSSIVELQNQQLEQVKQIVAQLNALFQVAEEFLSNVDETTDKLIEETAAIVQLRSDLAAEALAQRNASTTPPPS